MGADLARVAQEQLHAHLLARAGADAVLLHHLGCHTLGSSPQSALALRAIRKQGCLAETMLAL